MFLWLAMIGIPIIMAWLLLAGGQVDLTLLGAKIGRVPSAAVVPLCLPLLALAIWQYWVLTRADIRRLFGLGH